MIRENIEYDILAKNNPADRIRLDELVELMLDTVCSKRSSIRIAGDEFPTYQEILTGGALQCAADD